MNHSVLQSLLSGVQREIRYYETLIPECKSDIKELYERAEPGSAAGKYYFDNLNNARSALRWMKARLKALAQQSLELKKACRRQTPRPKKISDPSRKKAVINQI